MERTEAKGKQVIMIGRRRRQQNNNSDGKEDKMTKGWTGRADYDGSDTDDNADNDREDRVKR